MKTAVAILETMWDWRSMTTGAGYTQRAPGFFRINPDNVSGRRLYTLVGAGYSLLVTNACPQLVTNAKEHGTPDPAWLHENLTRSEEHKLDLLMVCGKVAQKTFHACGYQTKAFVLEIPHPAARFAWTSELIRSTQTKIADIGCPWEICGRYHLPQATCYGL